MASTFIPYTFSHLLWTNIAFKYNYFIPKNRITAQLTYNTYSMIMLIITMAVPSAWYKKICTSVYKKLLNFISDVSVWERWGEAIPQLFPFISLKPFKTMYTGVQDSGHCWYRGDNILRTHDCSLQSLHMEWLFPFTNYETGMVLPVRQH
jgi:hypothetical protein